MACNVTSSHPCLPQAVYSQAPHLVQPLQQLRQVGAPGIVASQRPHHMLQHHRRLPAQAVGADGQLCSGWAAALDWMG